MQFQEIVEAQGHLIDSHIMEQIFDKVVEFNGRFEVEEFRVGRTNSEPSFLLLKVEAADRGTMERLLQQPKAGINVAKHGRGCFCVHVRRGDARALERRTPRAAR